MKLSVSTVVFLSLFITMPGCSNPEETGQQVREKFNALKEAAVPIIDKAKAEAIPVIEKVKSDSQSFISGFMEENNNDDND